MKSFKLKICDIISHCCDVKTFRLKLDQDIFYKAGQYLSLFLTIGGRNVTKVFSISSSPTEKGYIDFTKKLTESDFSKALNALSIGDEVTIRMPMGSFILEEGYQRIAFLSGGIGITPIRSMLKYATDLKLSKDFILLYSGKSPEYFIFKTDFAQMCQSNSHLKVIYVLTGETREMFGYEPGYVNAGMIREKIQDYRQRIFFVCGPPGMVKGMRQILTEELGLSENRIVTEGFTGY